MVFYVMGILWVCYGYPMVNQDISNVFGRGKEGEGRYLQKFEIFLFKNLRMSNKCCNFAAYFT